jgi:hypothetical protein
MQIVRIEAAPIHRVSYRTAAPGRDGFLDETLAVVRAIVDRLPVGLDAIFATADLQGHVADPTGARPPRTLGEVVAEDLRILAELGTIPPAHRVGVLLSGDLHPGQRLDRRGGSGDVRTVWRAFAAGAAWVAGVAGNHDEFGPGPGDVEAFGREPGIHLLDGGAIDLDGLRLAGIGGIVGNPRKPFRRSEADFVGLLRPLLAGGPDILLLHDGPDFPPQRLLGNSAIRAVLEQAAPVLVVRGHAHWPDPLVRLPNGSQVLNVDGRGVLLCAMR